MTNLSTGGFCITSIQALPPETYLSLRLSRPVSNPALMTWVYVPYDVDLAVVRWAHGKESGLEILRIHPEELNRLNCLIEGESNVDRAASGHSPAR